MATSSTEAEKPSLEVMRRLFERMVAIYGHKWASTQGVSPQREGQGQMTIAGDTWRRGLAGLTPAQIGIGVDACIVRHDPWPPTLPEFRALCLQIPTFEDTRANVSARRVTPEPFYRLVWSLIDDPHRFRSQRAEDSERTLRQAYGKAREHVMRLRPMPEAPAGELPAPPVKRSEFDYAPIQPPPAGKTALDHLREKFAADSGESVDE